MQGRDVFRSHFIRAGRRAPVFIGTKQAIGGGTVYQKTATFAAGTTLVASESKTLNRSATVAAGTTLSAVRSTTFSRTATLAAGTTLRADRASTFSRAVTFLAATTLTATRASVFSRAVTFLAGTLASAARASVFSRLATLIAGTLATLTRQKTLNRNATFAAGTTLVADETHATGGGTVYSKTATFAAGTGLQAARATIWSRSATAAAGTTLGISRSHQFTKFSTLIAGTTLVAARIREESRSAFFLAGTSFSALGASAFSRSVTAAAGTSLQIGAVREHTRFSVFVAGTQLTAVKAYLQAGLIPGVKGYVNVSTLASAALASERSRVTLSLGELGPAAGISDRGSSVLRVVQVFSDDFNRPDGAVGNGWLSPVVTGEVVPQIVGSQLSANGDPRWVSAYRPETFSDFTVEFDYISGATSILTASEGIGIYWRIPSMPDPAAGYGAGLFSDYLLIDNLASGVVIDPAGGPNGSTAATLSNGTHVRVEVSGSSFKVYYDGALVLSATDPTFTAAGYLGVELATNVIIDNLVVSGQSKVSIDMKISESATFAGASDH